MARPARELVNGLSESESDSHQMTHNLEAWKSRYVPYARTSLHPSSDAVPVYAHLRSLALCGCSGIGRTQGATVLCG